MMNPHLVFADFFTNDKSLHPYLYFLSKKMNEGNICINLEQIEEYRNKQDEYENNLEIKKFRANKELITVDSLKDSSVKPFVLDNNKLYTQRYFSYETKFLEGIKSLINNENIEEKKEQLSSLKTRFNEIFKGKTSLKKNETDWQKTACLLAFLHNFTVITGGPGTGKTTTVSKLIELLLAENPKLKISIAAPTGKAAARLKETFKNNANEIIKELDPQTIHKLLGIRPNIIEPKFHKENTLDADLIIIDESSMIDVALFSKLIEAIDKERTKLVLLGDKNQLASVDAGSLFGDLCNSLEQLNQFDLSNQHFLNQFLGENTIQDEDISNQQKDHPLFQHIIELKKTYRFQENDPIHIFSKAVIEENIDDALRFLKDGIIVLGNEERQEFHSKEEWKHYFKKELINSYAKEKDIENALAKINDSKVLCALRKDVIKINDEFARIIIKEGKAKSEKMNQIFYNNRLIMITTNKKELKLANGDIGIVRSEDGISKFYFPIKYEDKEYYSIITGSLLAEEFEDAYGMTIHKSQGSEFNKVLIILPEEEREIDFMTKELLYTAVTRAKKLAVIFASEEQLKNIINKRVERVSGIKERWM